MAQRSTAAVGLTPSGSTSQQRPGRTAGGVTDDSRNEGQEDNGGASPEPSPDGSHREDATAPRATTTPAGRPASTTPAALTRPPELHSGHKLARRYRLEECVTRLDGFSSWRAVDEKLRRAVGVHLLPADHVRARHVLAAARSAALLGDPRFVAVLDAVEDNDLVYVVHEWLPDATTLAGLLAPGPLAAHEAYQLVLQLSQAVAAAHREGLAHLRISPTTVLRTGSGQYRVRGLAVGAALRGVSSDQPQREDTEAIGALLYAALTGRWPYEEDAYGLSGVGALSKGALVPPDQVRAGVHRGLSDLAMRALVNSGATASREEQPYATPEELARAVASLPRIRPPEQHFAPPPAYRHADDRRGTYGPPGPHAGAAAGGGATLAPGTPPALPGRAGKALKWGVTALLVAALGLGSWQVSETLLDRESPTDNTPAQPGGEPEEGPGGVPITIVGAKDFDPQGNGSENPEAVARAFDGDPGSFWYTQNYYGDPQFGHLKPGAGLILDLGKQQSVRDVTVSFEGRTSAELLAAPRSTVGMPTSYGAFRKTTGNTGAELAFDAGKEPLVTRYLLVWLTELPQATDGNYRGRITEIQVSG